MKKEEAKLWRFRGVDTPRGCYSQAKKQSENVKSPSSLYSILIPREDSPYRDSRTEGGCAARRPSSLFRGVR
jgi:hypothetical protein